MKLRCSGCKEYKETSEFNKANKIKRGYQTYCKTCKAKSELKRYHENLSNCPDYKAKKSKYDKKRREERSEYLSEYEKKRRKLPHRRASHAESTRRRRAAKGLQTPKWANLDRIRSIYESAKVLGDKFGVNYHVDHIIPLNGKDVCGLHVENNLQLLESSLNMSKGNKIKTHMELPRRYYA